MKRDWLILAGVVGAIIAFDFISGNDLVSDSLSDVLPGSVEATPTAQGILQALTGFENVASQHNNPGGVCGSFTNGICDGPATFDTLQEGTDAAIAAIQHILDNNPGITVADFVKKWSGGAGQVLQNYIDHVTDALGLTADEDIGDGSGGEE